MATRRCIRDLTSDEKKLFIDALFALKHERTGNDNLSTYDRYVVLHSRAMGQYSWFDGDLGATMAERFSQTLPPSNQNSRFLTRRNAAHRGPAFLPWHREYLRQFEADLQRILGDSNFGLPYWDWEHDGDLPVLDQKTTPVWDMLGGDGDPDFGNIVTTPPFGFDVSNNLLWTDPNIFADPKSWIIVDPMGRQNGFLRRALGRETDQNNNLLAPSLPTSKDVSDAVNNIAQYDESNWDEQSSANKSFRNVLEGFVGSSGLHNRIHQWVSGSMSPGTSPNDPVFFLHHCNVDRIWALWEQAHPNWIYVPKTNGPVGHNWSDLMYPWDGTTTSVSVTVEHASQSSDFDYAAPP